MRRQLVWHAFKWVKIVVFFCSGTDFIINCIKKEPVLPASTNHIKKRNQSSIFVSIILKYLWTSVLWSRPWSIHYECSRKFKDTQRVKFWLTRDVRIKMFLLEIITWKLKLKKKYFLFYYKMFDYNNCNSFSRSLICIWIECVFFFKSSNCFLLTWNKIKSFSKNSIIFLIKKIIEINSIFDDVDT